jgi:hypothetical protein
MEQVITGTVRIQASQKVPTTAKRIYPTAPSPANEAFTQAKRNLLQCCFLPAVGGCARSPHLCPSFCLSLLVAWDDVLYVQRGEKRKRKQQEHLQRESLHYHNVKKLATVQLYSGESFI